MCSSYKMVTLTFSATPPNIFFTHDHGSIGMEQTHACCERLIIRPSIHDGWPYQNPLRGLVGVAWVVRALSEVGSATPPPWAPVIRVFQAPAIRGNCPIGLLAWGLLVGRGYATSGSTQGVRLLSPAEGLGEEDHPPPSLECVV